MLTLIQFKLMTLMILCSSPLEYGWANVHFLPRTPQQLNQAKADPMVKVAGAEVAYANYAALRRDFPHLQGKSDGALRDWILENFAYISEAQLRLSHVRNSPIPLERAADGNPRRKDGYRPEDYGRAAVLSAVDDEGQEVGLIDIKGAGVERQSHKVEGQIMSSIRDNGNPQRMNELRTKDHSDGLMSLGEAIAELTRQQGAQALFDWHNSQMDDESSGKRLETVESYFIISLPFEILKDNGHSIPAALYGRQAHLGRTDEYDVPEHLYQDEHGHRQSDYFGAAVDFGGVGLTHPLLQKSFGPPSKNPQESLAWKYGHEVAKAYMRPDNPDKEVIERHLREMLAPLEGLQGRPTPERLPQDPRANRQSLTELIKKNLQDPQLKVRRNAALGMMGLGGSPDQGFEEILETIYRDGDEDVLSSAIKALQVYSGSKKRDFLIKALQDPRSSVRFAAALGARGFAEAGDAQSELGQSLKNLYASAIKNGHPEDWYAALHSLMDYPGPDFDQLIKMALDHSEPHARAYGAMALPAYKGPRARTFYAYALNDPDPSVREVAALKLSGYPGEELEELEELFYMALADHEPRVRQAALLALERMPSERVKSVILQLRTLEPSLFGRQNSNADFGQWSLPDREIIQRQLALLLTKSHLENARQRQDGCDSWSKSLASLLHYSEIDFDQLLSYLKNLP